jgi:release factor glutamine methyltransferase
MKKALQYIIHPFYKRYHFWYHRKPRKYSYKKVYTRVQPGVFSPKHTVSTKVFLDFIGSLTLPHQRVLELGCGSGIIALQAAYMGAITWASDINEVAIESLQKVSKEQGLKVHAVVSDLFNALPSEPFDFIFINPPYYPQQPQNVSDQAWFCGAHFEYFKALFPELQKQVQGGAQVFMILSDQCALDTLKEIADQSNLHMQVVYERQLTFERNFVFQIVEKT